MCDTPVMCGRFTSWAVAAAAPSIRQARAIVHFVVMGCPRWSLVRVEAPAQCFRNSLLGRPRPGLGEYTANVRRRWTAPGDRPPEILGGPAVNPHHVACAVVLV